MLDCPVVAFLYLSLWLCRLVGDVLLATGFLSYSGPFNQSFRTLLTERWQKEMLENKIPFTKNLNLSSMLTDAATVSALFNILQLQISTVSMPNGLQVAFHGME
jgi:dynein heavy chain